MSGLPQGQGGLQFGQLAFRPSQSAAALRAAGVGDGSGTGTGVAAYGHQTQAAAPAGVLDVQLNQNPPQIPGLPAIDHSVPGTTTTNIHFLSDDELTSSSPPAKPINAPNNQWSTNHIQNPKAFPAPTKLRDTSAFKARKHMRHLLVPDAAHLPAYLNETQRRSSMTASEIAKDHFDLAEQRKRQLHTKEGYLKEQMEKGSDVAAREAVEVKKNVGDRRARKRKARFVPVEKKVERDTTQYTLDGLQYGTQNMVADADVKPKSDGVFTGPLYDEDDWGYLGYK